MSVFHGKQYKGAMREHRVLKHEEAKERNGRTQVSRRRRVRRNKVKDSG